MVAHRYFSCAWSVFGSIILNCNMKGNVKFVQYSAKKYELDDRITIDEVDLYLPCGVCARYDGLRTTQVSIFWHYIVQI